MNKAQEKPLFPDAGRGWLSRLREKTGGRNGAKLYAVAVALYGILIFMVIVAWYKNPFRSSGFFTPEFFLCLAAGLLTLGSAVLLGFGRRTGWILSAPIIATMSTLLIGGTLSKPYYSLPYDLDFLLILCPALTVVQAFRPSVLAALSLRRSVAVSLYAVPCVLLLIKLIS